MYFDCLLKSGAKPLLPFRRVFVVENKFGFVAATLLKGGHFKKTHFPPIAREMLFYINNVYCVLFICMTENCSPSRLLVSLALLSFSLTVFCSKGIIIMATH